MRDPSNIRSVEHLDIRMMGFIFYKESKRYVDTLPSYLPTHVKRVGVFVDSPIAFIIEHIKTFGLQYIQLHGNETPSFCRTIKENCSIEIIKAFGINEKTEWHKMIEYEDSCSYFLFDTACSSHGGSGIHFDWSLLSNYNLKTPFLLSGGIHLNSAERLNKIHHPSFAGIDLNSNFETAPTIKDIKLLENFLSKLQSTKKQQNKKYNE